MGQVLPTLQRGEPFLSVHKTNPEDLPITGGVWFYCSCVWSNHQ